MSYVAVLIAGMVGIRNGWGEANRLEAGEDLNLREMLIRLSPEGYEESAR